MGNQIRETGFGTSLNEKVVDFQPLFLFLLLPDLDSNQDKQNQNLSYYHYTIGHPNQLLDSLGMQK